jgi:hypothetical protein
VSLGTFEWVECGRFCPSLEPPHFPRLTVAAGSQRFDEDSAVEISQHLGRCWISTIGYRIKQIPTKFVVCDYYRSFTITVHAGSRGPIANK